MLGNNPFSNRIIIKNPSEFYGRKNELTTINQRLLNLQSCDIYGERRIGKSSLLYNIFLTIQQKTGDGYKVAYIDMQDPKFHTVEGFLKYSLKEFGIDSSMILPSKTINENLITFSESIEELRKECKPVLLIDECENMVKRPEFKNDLFETMRSLGNNGNIAYVTASLHSLKALVTNGDFTSPFYNIFVEVPLKNFPDEETSDFLLTSRNGFEFNDSEIEFIKESADNKPINLQIASFHVYKNREEKLDEKKLKANIINEIKNFKDKNLRVQRGILKHRKSIFNFCTEIIKDRLKK